MANKSKQKYGIFAKFSLAVIGACEVANNPHIFINRANQYIQEIHRHSDVTLNHFGPIVIASNQEQNGSYAFKEILLQPGRSDFILAMIKKVESHESINHWTLMKKIKVNNNHKNRDGNLIHLVFQAQ